MSVVPWSGNIFNFFMIIFLKITDFLVFFEINEAPFKNLVRFGDRFSRIRRGDPSEIEGFWAKIHVFSFWKIRRARKRSKNKIFIIFDGFLSPVWGVLVQKYNLFRDFCHLVGARPQGIDLANIVRSAASRPLGTSVALQTTQQLRCIRSISLWMCS